MGIKSILYITNSVSAKDFTLVGPVQYLYVYGLRRLLGENNVKLTNKINIKDIENYDAILIGRDLLDNLTTRNITNSIINKYSCRKVLSILDTEEDLLVDKIIYNNNIKCYIKREIPNFFINKKILKRYLMSFLNRKFNVVFLSEYIKFYNKDLLIPCPLTYHLLNKELIEKTFSTKKYLVSYITNLHPATGNLFGRLYRYEIHKERIKLAAIARSVPNSFVRLGYGLPGSGLPFEQYCKIISESYSSLNTTAYDNYRRYEITYLGSVLISERPLDITPNDFIEGKHAFFYDNIKELKSILKDLKGREDELIKMGREAREHAIKYHSPEARAKTILEALNK